METIFSSSFLKSISSYYKALSWQISFSSLKILLQYLLSRMFFLPNYCYHPYLCFLCIISLELLLRYHFFPLWFWAFCLWCISVVFPRFLYLEFVEVLYLWLHSCFLWQIWGAICHNFLQCFHHPTCFIQLHAHETAQHWNTASWSSVPFPPPFFISFWMVSIYVFSGSLIFWGYFL